MKQSPKYTQIQEQLMEGQLSLKGFLGEDTRPIIDILLSDQEIVHHLGLTHKKIATKMNELLQIGLKELEEWIIINDALEIFVEEFRGKIPCPFHHPGLYPKIHVIAFHHGLNKKIYWSPLSIHLIEKHGFYQGKGATYRINPKEIAYFLKLI